MTHTILLSTNPSGLSRPVTRGLFVILGLVNVAKGLLDIITVELPAWQWAFNAVMVLSGLVLLLLGWVLFDPTSRWAPKVVIDDSKISIREKLWKEPTTIPWQELTRIEFSSFEMNFFFSNRTTQRVLLKTDADTSITIKRTLREVARGKQVEVVEGRWESC